MPASSDIYSRIAPAQENSLLKNYGDALAIQGTQNQNAMAAYGLKKAQRSDDETNALAALLKQGVDLSTPQGQAQAYGVAPTVAPTFIKSRIDQQKAQADIGKTNADTETSKIAASEKRIDLVGQAFNFVRHKPTLENAIAAIDHLQQNGVYDAATANQMRAKVQANPQAIQENAELAFRTATKTKDQLLTHQQTNLGGTSQGSTFDSVTGQTTVTSTAPITQSADNAASQATSRANNAATVGATIRGQNLTDARSRETTAATMTKPFEVTGPDGTPMLVQQDKQGNITPVQGFGPKAVKQKDIPATANSKIIEGKQSISNIDSTIQAIKDYPDALGFTNAIPGSQSIRQVTDPKGVAARAQVANIGSLVLHDRSGAAVSASEFPRLAPFIPSASDKPDAAIKKLERMKQIAEEELGLFADTYSSDNGYKASPLLKNRSQEQPDPLGLFKK